MKNGHDVMFYESSDGLARHLAGDVDVVDDGIDSDDGIESDDDVLFEIEEETRTLAGLGLDRLAVDASQESSWLRVQATDRGPGPESEVLHTLLGVADDDGE